MLWKRMGVGGAANHTSTANMSHVPLGSGLHEFSQAVLRQLFLQTSLLYMQPNRLACQFTDPQMWIHIPSSYLESPDLTTVKLIKQGDPCTEVALQSEATPNLSLGMAQGAKNAN